MREKRQNVAVLAATVFTVLLGVLLLRLPGDVRGDAAQPQADPAVRIMAVGDSITQGAPGDLTWRWYLDRYLTADGTDFDMVGPRDTLGSNDDRTLSAEQYADPDFDADHAAWWGDSYVLRKTGEPRDLVKAHDPDVVVLALGTNDISLWHATGAETLDRAKTWVTEAREVKPSLDVVLVAVPGRSPEHDAYNAGLAGLAALLSSEKAKAVAAPWPADYRVSVYPGDGGDTRDGVHPNSAGQAKIAHAVAQALAELDVGRAPSGPFDVVPDAPLEASPAPPSTAPTTTPAPTLPEGPVLPVPPASSPAPTF